MNKGWSVDEAMNRAMDDMPCIPLERPVGDEDSLRVLVYPADRSSPFLGLPL